MTRPFGTIMQVSGLLRLLISFILQIYNSLALFQPCSLFAHPVSFSKHVEHVSEIPNNSQNDFCRTFVVLDSSPDFVTLRCWAPVTAGSWEKFYLADGEGALFFGRGRWCSRRCGGLLPLLATLDHALTVKVSPTIATAEQVVNASGHCKNYPMI